MIVTKKKTTKRVRHAQVAREFEKWMRENPNAPQSRRLKMFDAICDSHHEYAQAKRKVIEASGLESPRSSTR